MVPFRNSRPLFSLAFSRKKEASYVLSHKCGGRTSLLYSLCLPVTADTYTVFAKSVYRHRQRPFRPLRRLRYAFLGVVVDVAFPFGENDVASLMMNDARLRRMMSPLARLIKETICLRKS